jgi:membrane protease YdiL (CAAX protease family)
VTDQQETESPKSTADLNAAGSLVDLATVVLVSLLASFIERLANDAGWISVPDSASGVSAVIGGFLTAGALVYFRNQSLAEIGFRRPQRWATVPIWVIGILVVYFACEAVVPALVGQFMTIPTPDLSRYDSIYGNLPAAIAMALVLPFTASIPEELIYRGFLMDRLTRIFGRSSIGAIATVVVQALVFGAAHFQWGPGGIFVTFIMGLIWGTAFLLSGRNLWIVILAHSAGHILFVAQLYLVKASEISKLLG